MILSLTPAETIAGVSCEGGVTSVPGADSLTTDVRTLVSVGTGYWVPGTSAPDTGHQEATPACTPEGSNCER